MKIIKDGFQHIIPENYDSGFHTLPKNAENLKSTMSKASYFRQKCMDRNETQT